MVWFSIPIQLWIGSFAPRFIQNTYKNHIFILDCDSLPWDFHWRESGENLHGLNSSQLTLIACGKSMNLRSHCRKISLARIYSPFFFLTFDKLHDTPNVERNFRNQYLQKPLFVRYSIQGIEINKCSKTWRFICVIKKCAENISLAFIVKSLAFTSTYMVISLNTYSLRFLI